MNLQTYVTIPKASFDISHHSSMLLFGSCFSDNIGKRLLDNKFFVNVNPFGILYNPISILNAINRLLDKEYYSEKDFDFHNNLYYSFMHHGSFSRPRLADAIDNVNQVFDIASSNLEKADVLLITFGTSFVYRLKADGTVVGNCHKLPASSFSKERLSIDDISASWTNLLTRVINSNPKLKIVFTVSPIRHFNEGAHQNQLSKSILLLSIEGLVNRFSENVYYFPAYEIMMDQLRDYRFYTDDMMHPSLLSQSYIWERFGETYFSDETIKINNEWQKISQALNHKAYNPNSDSYRLFLARTIDDIEAFEDTYPFLSCLLEKQHLTQLLKKYSIEF